MDARSIIAAKRDGRALGRAEIGWFARGLADGQVTDAQAGAFAMAVLLNGMGREERADLTLAMRDSGEVLEWDLPGPVLDKHSTGGIGDNTSLILAPALAVCGAYVPMISGRGLGHTGGTLDKLDAIPGYRTAVSNDRLRKVVKDIGCAIVGATGDIAPADRRLYGIRDVTGTVESIDLITASILSKKLAAGLEGLVLDVKWGTGAFMAARDDARALARSLVDTAKAAGCATTALLTDMNEPLAPAAGNALEVISALDCLTGADIDNRLWDVTVALGGELLATGGLATDAEAGRAKIAAAIEDGRAAERFGQMVTALGGPSDFVERYRDRMPEAAAIGDVAAGTEGFVTGIDARAVGEVVVALGGGRLRADDQLDLSVGLDHLVGLGARVGATDPIARVHARDDAGLRAASDALHRAYRIEPAPAAENVLIVERFD